MSVYVFLGPTLSVAEARRVVDAIYLPPAAAGDVLALMKRDPQVIGIVDGYFDQVPSVRHKEILYAMNEGVRVLGAASMGALRAAELCDFGMEGVGGVFEAFQSGALEDDDEVAVVHGPADSGYQPLSEALVNLRAGLRGAAAHGVISAATHDILLRSAKTTFYPERSWKALEHAGRALGITPEERGDLLGFVAREQPNAKRDDALALLERIAIMKKAGIARHVPDFVFEPTLHFRRFMAAVGAKQAARG